MVDLNRHCQLVVDLNFNSLLVYSELTGSGTITSINLRIYSSQGFNTTVNWGAIRVDGSILVNDVTGKVVTPTNDNTRSVPPSPKNPFDVFAVDGTAYQTATASRIYSRNCAC